MLPLLGLIVPFYITLVKKCTLLFTVLLQSGRVHCPLTFLNKEGMIHTDAPGQAGLTGGYIKCGAKTSLPPCRYRGWNTSWGEAGGDESGIRLMYPMSRAWPRFLPTRGLLCFL